MKTRILRVNGHNYKYARSTIFIAQGKSEKIEKSLGRHTEGKDFSDKEGIFNEFVKEQEIKKRVAYWKDRMEDPVFRGNAALEKLEGLRAELYRAKKDMGRLAAELMEMGFVIDFIYNSNRIEGSRVPRERVEKEVRQNKKTKGEVGNTLQALMEIEKAGFKFDTKSIVNLHAILMAHEPQKLGLRKDRVIVGNSEVCPWEDVPGRLAELCRWYKEKKTTMYPPELAFEFYYRFERIHPFEDGNGRTGRLLMNRILRDSKYHPIIISWKRKEAQENAFAKRMEGRKRQFFEFMKEEFVKTHEICIAKIDSALGVQKLSQVFMEPSPHYE